MTISSLFISRFSLLRWGLRLKTALVLVALATVTLLLALLVGWWAVENIRSHFGEGFARNHTLLTQQRILAVIGRDLALSQRLAESPLLQEWLLDEDDSAKQTRLEREVAQFSQGFTGRSYFITSALSGHYYFGDADSDGQPVLRYTLDADNPADAWFFATLDSVEDYAINVNPDAELQVTNMWLNVIVKDAHGTPIGIAGTGFNLSQFLQKFVAATEPGVTTVLIDQNGAIMAHPNPDLIEYAAITREQADQTLLQWLDNPQSVNTWLNLQQRAQADPLQAPLARVDLDGREQLAALSYLPELDWFVVTHIDLTAHQIVSRNLLVGAGVAGGGLVILLLLTTTLGMDRLVLMPLSRLTQSVQAIAHGDYATRLHSSRHDEIGQLHQAVDTMAQQIRQHTATLEQRVAERTQALADAHDQIAQAHRQLTDSIDYAGLIQHSLLPDRALAEQFPGEYFVLWLPRDTVGGDFYFYRSTDKGHVVGLVDCAGHGVAGAIMTMMAHAALEMALDQMPADDPAALLTRTDDIIRAMLPDAQRHQQLAMTMDVGLCCLNPQQRTLVFAGAHINLFWSDGHASHEVTGQRRGLNDRRRGRYTNTDLAIPPEGSVYLLSDGLLDQSGGAQGYGFGKARFNEWMRTHAGQPLSAQDIALRQVLADYQGDQPQRDDITVLGFRPYKP